MSAKTRDFAAKARTIVGGSRPMSLKDFLEDERGAGNTESRADDVRKTGNTESRADDVRKTGNTESRADDVRKTGNTESRADDVRKTGNTESRADDVRKTGNTESRTDDVRKTGNTEDQATQPRSDLARIVSMKGTMVAKSTEREEFRFDSDLAERLRRCAFETRRKKTSIVKEALERYLREQGF